MSTVEEVLKEMREYASEYKVPIISPAGGSLLAQLVASRKAISILEIGTAIGYSTLLMAQSMSSAGQIVTMEQDEQRISLAKDFLARAGMAERVEIIAGDAGLELTRLSGKFDFVFIDAAKGQYLDYLHKVMDKLSANAVIIADNVLFRGMVLSEEEPPKRYRTIVRRLREYIDFINHDLRFTSMIMKQGDGLAISYYQGSED
ncbi:MAG: O-methyltransferase [Pelosinus sp.]|nr:O-methyltransferase [Pelosinus sp.]